MLRKYLTDYLSQIQRQIDGMVEDNNKFLTKEHSNEEHTATWFFMQGWLMSLYIEREELKKMLSLTKITRT